MTNAITVNTPSGANRALTASLHVYRIMLKLNDMAPLELMETGLGGTIERGDVSILKQGLLKSMSCC